MKERIIQAAEQEILQRGFKFTIRDLAAGLGVSTKTLYQYFESKERIIEHIVERAVAEMKEAEAAIMADGTLNTLQKLRKALVVLPQRFLFTDIRILQELRKRYPKQWREIDKYVTTSWDHIRSLVKEGMAEGVLRPFDIEIFIQIYIGALYRLMDDQTVRNTELPLEKALVQMVDLLLRGIVSLDPQGD
ncbi:TetR/AcrR family transcriptional regulator [Paenibacillus sp. TH7-28]